MDSKVMVILGAGPGLGAAIARRFAREGFAVALMARRKENLSAIRQEIEDANGTGMTVEADATDAESVAQAFDQVREGLGDPEVFTYNAGAFQMGSILDLIPEQFDNCFRANCSGAFYGAQQVLPAMMEKGSGTIILTGATASLRGSANFAALATGKFGLRALAQSMAREFGPQGIHVAHVVIDGQIDTLQLRESQPDREVSTTLSPDAIADIYWELHTQDPRAWTLELDLRPAVEKF
ncbi:MAG TPA: SDR family NAD(P)-dependent oxidoreductase [Rubrobacteraceae bacterium]|nr:SDR family NAD(P)-dependent oxidoreductase [Rubrobacteraceae bacterium]